MLLLRANTLALGHSGCRPVIVDRLLAFLDHGIHPVVPEQGSVGASGDLAPLAHLALPLIGRGEVEVGGTVVPAGQALREAGLEPLELGPKEGLALLNGTQLMGAIGALLLADADRLVRTASRRSRDERRGAARDGCGLRRRLPARATAPGPGRGRRASSGTCCATAISSAAITTRPTRSRTRTRCAACRRSTARSAMPSTTSVACWTSSSTRRPTTRSSSRAGAWRRSTRSRPAAAGSSAAATSTASRSPSRSTSPSSRSRSSARSASAGRRCSSTRG